MSGNEKAVHDTAGYGCLATRLEATKRFYAHEYTEFNVLIPDYVIYTKWRKHIGLI
jgi:hypothetical protein